MSNCKIDVDTSPEEYTSLFEDLIKKKITHVDAGYRKFKIIPTKNLFSGDEKCWGVTDFDRCIIYLEIDVDDDTVREVFLHELTHILFELIGLGGSLEDDKGALPPNAIPNNEYLTTISSRMLMLLMRLNPQLYKLLI